ncbi:MAG: T9SS type A sorting domain-containing protein [Cryomorphaceae bacterium]|nr:T9SS type A sorting domain-containing protein [Cryomorphaceae bacterium]
MNQSLRFSCFSIILIIFSANHTTRAAHLVGGELTYRYIGDSTNTPHHYLVSLKLLRSPHYTTLNVPQSYNLCLTSTCFPNQTITVNQTSPPNGVSHHGQLPCLDTTSPGYFEVYTHTYESTVVLPSPCSDIRFRFSFPCCRVAVANTDNYMANGSGGSTNFLHARLNTDLGDVTSPQFLVPEVPINVCHGQNVFLNHGAESPQGDSLVYRFNYGKNGGCTGSFADMVMSPGYSQDQPFMTDTGVVVLDNNGMINFRSSNSIQGNYVYVVVAQAYRFSPTLNDYVLVGTSYREYWLTVRGTCQSETVNGASLKSDVDSIPTTNFGPNILNILPDPQGVANADTIFDPNDSTQFEIALPAFKYNCLSTEIEVEFSQPVMCNSISPDGSEFRITSPDSFNIPIIGIQKNCNEGVSQSVILELAQPLPMNGDYIISIKNGTDGNTLMNPCGFFMLENTVIVLQSIDCPIISTEKYFRNKSANFKVYPNPNQGVFSVVPESPTGDFIITLINLQGVAVIKKQTNVPFEIQAENLPSGLYIIQVENRQTGAVRNQRVQINSLE